MAAPNGWIAQNNAMQRARDDVRRVGWSLCREPLIATGYALKHNEDELMKRLSFAILFAAACLLLGCNSKDTSTTARKGADEFSPAEQGEGGTTAVAATNDAEDEYPRIIWRRTHSSGSFKGAIALSSVNDLKHPILRHLDWSDASPERPSIAIELDKVNSLTIETDATAGGDKRPIIATRRRASDTQGSATAVLVTRSKPLKDAHQGMDLLQAYYTGSDEFQSRVEWELPESGAHNNTQ